MKVDTIVTLGDGKKYYLADETVQNDVKYFLANVLDEEENATLKSVILEENVFEEGSYLNEVTDKEELGYLSAIFAANFNNEIDDKVEA